MKFIQAVLLLLLSGALAFGYWGLYTASGRLAYDEMDGILPLASFWISIVGLGLFVVVKILLNLKRKKRGS